MSTALKPKHQRLVLVVVALLAILAAGALAAWGLRNQASYFYVPSDVAAKPPATGQAVRLGGMVEPGSLAHEPDGVTIRFVVGDGKARVPVVFSGIVPDLFTEGSGVVAEGSFEPGGTFRATNLLAKHDENYVPRELEDMTDAQKRETIAETSEMIAEFGLAALWLAAALAALQFVSGLLSLREGGAELAAIVRPAAVVQAILCGLSFVMLIWLFARTDLSVLLVASNSHSEKPFIFKVAGAWGNHEGSMLMWVSIMALGGGLIALIERRLPERTLLATLAAQAFVGLGFYAFLLFSSNPFERLQPVPADGAGLNPLLQDLGLAFHPPTLYLGYVGLSIAFSFAVGAMLTRNVTPDFARVMRPWVLGAWCFLTLGITAGSYWAYYELGWGGWWFWDPVENASLMPWLAATALLHSASVLAARDALRTWTIMLGVVAFSMSMIGTFLVRSGILTSVHAFAVDPERGSFILVLLTIYIGGALALFAARAGTIAEGERFAPLSREGALVVNNVALSAILGIVLVGTLYPLLTEAFGVRVSVGPPYFNPVSAMFLVPMLLVLLAGPLLRWRHDSFARVQKSVALAVSIGLVALLGLAVVAGPGLLPLIGMALAAAVAVASVLPLWGRNLRRVPLATWGMVAAHLGVAVALFGMGADSAFTVEKLAAVKPGATIAAGPWLVRLDSIEPVAGENWTALEGRMTARYGSGTPHAIAPQARTFWNPPQQTTESALLTRWNGQLYAVLGEEAEGGRWQVRLWWKPFVTWIWLGGMLIALGGLLALIGRIAADLRLRERRRLIAQRRGIKLDERWGGGMSGWRFWVPAALFFALVCVFALQLSRDKDEFVESTMIGKPVPDFALRAAIPERPGVSRGDLADGTPHLMNIFASWCVPCVAEAPQLAALERAGAPIFGVAIRDTSEDLQVFLAENGNPYSRIGADDLSDVQFKIGSSGVPETFVVDGQGVIRYQHIGDIRDGDVPLLLEKLREAGG